MRKYKFINNYNNLYNIYYLLLLFVVIQWNHKPQKFKSTHLQINKYEKYKRPSNTIIDNNYSHLTLVAFV